MFGAICWEVWGGVGGCLREFWGGVGEVLGGKHLQKTYKNIQKKQIANKVSTYFYIFFHFLLFPFENTV